MLHNSHAVVYSLFSKKQKKTKLREQTVKKNIVFGNQLSTNQKWEEWNVWSFLAIW